METQIYEHVMFHVMDCLAVWKLFFINISQDADYAGK